MSRDSRYLEELLHHDIPLTRALGLRVEQWENHELRVKVPLQENINHKSSMFGGSLYCASRRRRCSQPQPASTEAQ